MNFPAHPGLGKILPQITHGQKDPLDLASILASLLPRDGLGDSQQCRKLTPIPLMLLGHFFAPKQPWPTFSRA